MNSQAKNGQRGRAAAAEQRAAGFTILETVIALFVAMVVGFGAISLFLFSMTYNAGASDRARALALAQQRLEGYRAKPFNDLATVDATEQVQVGGTASGQVDQHTFAVRTRIEFDTTVPNNRQRVITVTVTPAAGGRWTAGAVTLRMLRASDKMGAN